jgi:hypothetical protein
VEASRWVHTRADYVADFSRLRMAPRPLVTLHGRQPSTTAVSGTTPATHSILGSKKTHGSGSRMQASRRPLASAGLEGITTFRPGTWGAG